VKSNRRDSIFLLCGDIPMSQGESGGAVQAATPEIDQMAQQIAPEVEARLAGASGGEGRPTAGAGAVGPGVASVLNIVLMVMNMLHEQGVFRPAPQAGAAGAAPGSKGNLGSGGRPV
jgi:hypothetical protein